MIIVLKLLDDKNCLVLLYCMEIMLLELLIKMLLFGKLYLLLFICFLLINGKLGFVLICFLL